MAFRYGGEVTTRSMEASSTGSLRASACFICAATSGALSLVKGRRSTTVFERLCHASNPLGRGLPRTLCGRDREISSANETPADLAIIRLDNVTQARSRYLPRGMAAISSASANSCFCERGGDQYFRNAWP